MPLNYEPLQPDHAEACGLRPLTTPLHAEEMWIALAVASDLRAGNIKHALVSSGDGCVEVWRDRAGWKGESSHADANS